MVQSTTAAQTSSDGRRSGEVAAKTLAETDPAITSAATLLARIETGIQRGEFGAGDRLPPVRSAAAALGLAPNTVAAAYRRLTERGLAVGEGRRGTFVADRTPAEQPGSPDLRSGLIDLSSGNPDPALLPDLRGALDAINTDHVSYGDPPIDPDLAEHLGGDIAADLAIRFEPVGGRNLAVVGGALDGIERVLTAHLRHGDRVAVEDPGYSSVLHLVKALGLRPVPVDLDDAGPTPDGLTAALSAGSRCLIVTPRAQNPTGATISADRATTLTRILADHPEVLVIEDDHAGPVAGTPHHSIIGPATIRWAVIRSLAKSLGPDLRVAGLVGDETTVSRVIGRQLLGTGWVSHLLQRTATTLLTDPETPPLLARASTAYRTKREAALAVLAASGVPASAPSGLNVWVPVADEAHVVAGMQRRGFAVLAGSRFRQGSDPAVRISVGPADLDAVAGAAEALAELLTTGLRSRSA